MNLFFDSSAVIKLFHKERRTERLRQLLLDSARQPNVSELARLEFYSTLYRLRREKNVGHRGLVTAFEKFEAEWIIILPLSHWERSLPRKLLVC